MKAFNRNFSRNVRVRFAPSPTGNLHLGGLRTALYNFLFAKQNEGKFILRIEDTDRTRLVPHAMEQLENDLNWVGLTPDESPSTGGKFGPYIQSERSEIYKEFAGRLVKSGAAYYCFCTDRRLELLRKEAVRSRTVPKYDNRCRALSHEEIKSKFNSGIEYCVRLKLIPSEAFDDVVYGTFLHEVQNVEGDPVILKADGWPTYHLANVVDDYLMNISHVIRGTEWLLSTNKHIMIYRALGYEPPIYAHLPLLINSDGTKLSKRQNDITVQSMRTKGVFPRALINFVTQAGGGFPEKIDKNSSLEELIAKFDLKSVSTNSGKLPDRLPEFNQREIIRRANNETDLNALVVELKGIIQQSFQNRLSSEELDINENHIRSILLWSLPRIHYLSDLVGKDMEFLWMKPNSKLLKFNCEPEILNNIQRELSLVDFKKETLVPFFKKFSEENSIPFKQLMGILRLILSGLKQGPGVADMMEILGKTTSLERIERAKSYLVQ